MQFSGQYLDPSRLRRWVRLLREKELAWTGPEVGMGLASRCYLGLKCSRHQVLLPPQEEPARADPEVGVVPDLRR